MASVAWTLIDFLARYDQWVEREEPSDDERVMVLSWVHSLQTNPYRGATRRLDLGIDQWFAEVPDGADDEDADAVVAFYRIEPEDAKVTCSVITKLRRPIVP